MCSVAGLSKHRSLLTVFPTQQVAAHLGFYLCLSNEIPCCWLTGHVGAVGSRFVSTRASLFNWPRRVAFRVRSMTAKDQRCTQIETDRPKGPKCMKRSRRRLKKNAQTTDLLISKRGKLPADDISPVHCLAMFVWLANGQNRHVVRQKLNSSGTVISCCRIWAFIRRKRPATAHSAYSAGAVSISDDCSGFRPSCNKSIYPKSV